MSKFALTSSRPSRRRLVAAVSLVAFGLVTATGCGPAGPSFQPVGGTVTVDGKTPSGVQVSFYPVDGKGPIASGNVDSATGRYDLTSSGGVGKPAGKGAVPGKYKVVLNSTGGGAGSAEAMMAQYGGGGKAPAVPKASFPKEYGSATTSPKEVEVKSGTNTINLEL